MGRGGWAVTGRTKAVPSAAAGQPWANHKPPGDNGQRWQPIFISGGALDGVDVSRGRGAHCSSKTVYRPLRRTGRLFMYLNQEQGGGVVSPPVPRLTSGRTTPGPRRRRLRATRSLLQTPGCSCAQTLAALRRPQCQDVPPPSTTCVEENPSELVVPSPDYEQTRQQMTVQIRPPRTGSLTDHQQNSGRCTAPPLRRGTNRPSTTPPIAPS